MEATDVTTKPLHHRRAATATTTATYPSFTHEEEKMVAEGGGDDSLLLLSKPAGWLVQMVSSQVEIITTTLSSISSAFLSLLSDSKASAEETPSRVSHRGGTLLKKLGSGLLGAAYACFVLLAVLVVAVLLGVGIVRMWVEEPVSLRKPLYFDYTEVNPSAAVVLGGGGGVKGKAVRPVPLGHTFSVSLVLVLPESDFNREIGVFQVTAEVIGLTGDIVLKSSQPCMLRFRSLPVRLMRTFLMGVPLLMGISCETQKLTIGVLKYKEINPRTEAIRVKLKPRAGTYDLPQLYEAELLMKSQLPWRKKLAYNWKWTFYVWVSLYVYVMLLILLVCCFKPFSFVARRSRRAEPEAETERIGPGEDGEMDSEFAEALRKWRARRGRKRKVVAVSDLPPSTYQRLPTGLVEGSGSSMAGGETGEVIDDSSNFAASESSESFGG